MGMNRKTAHSYPKIFTGVYGQVRDVIVIEATWFGYYEPFAPHLLSSYIHGVVAARDQQGMVEEYGLQPFEVNVLLPTRTLCEKIISLVRFSYSDNPIDHLRMKIRHVYDLHMMLKNVELKSFFDSAVFARFLCRVAQDDVQSFRNNNQWLAYHPNNSLLFKDIDNVWNQLKAAYTGDFSGLVYGDLPSEEDVVYNAC